ncbi:hypothetical protein [Phytohabitans flavus]|nr:hypothetical protein [Phytohabitans flavus]
MASSWAMLDRSTGARVLLRYSGERGFEYGSALCQEVGRRVAAPV